MMQVIRFYIVKILFKIVKNISLEDGGYIDIYYGYNDLNVCINLYRLYRFNYFILIVIIWFMYIYDVCIYNMQCRFIY